MVEVLVPIFCGCVLPVAIVLIVSLRKKNSDNKRAEVMIKAIESGEEVKAVKLAEALGKPILSPQEMLNARLLNITLTQSSLSTVRTRSSERATE